MNTLEEAQKVSVIMAKLRNAINTAERLGLEIPLKVKKVYNDALSRIQRHNYFGSEALQAALDGAYPL
ncbi:MAG: hypothetical protein IKW48_09475 [Akkermansia sp.]|nr:hypothetical protein [Akkermansia sp.]